MTWETQQHFLQPDHRFLLFVFSATLLTYFFHALVNTIYTASSDRHSWNNQNKNWVVILFLLSGCMTVFSWWPYKQHIWPLLGAAIATFLYSAPNLPLQPFISMRKIAIGKTVYLAAVWTYVTAFLPLLINNAVMSPTFWYYALHRFFLVFAICILFDRRDVTDDQSKGVRTLATMTNEKVLRITYSTCLGLSAVMAAMFSSPVFISYLHIPVFLAAFLYPAKENEWGDIFYFLVLYGLMMLSACIYAIMVLVF
jgi:4-hydroxybenzoate polyprenyltransferase